MKKIIFVACILLSKLVIAQQIKIEAGSEKINEIIRKGQYVLLELDKKQVDKYWENYIKKFGKSSTKSGVTIIETATINEISKSPCAVYSIIDKTENGSRVWWAIDLGNNWVSEETKEEYKNAEKLLYEFALTAYKEDINSQLADAEKALIASTKIYQKEVKEGITLLGKIEQNTKEKIDLEKALIRNKEVFEKLNIAIDKNIQEQKLAINNVETIKATHKSNPTPEEAKSENKALQKALKEQEKKVEQGSKLASDLEKNKNEKIKLNKDLMKNVADAFEFENAQKQNIIDQEAASIDVEKMKKAIEVVKAKLIALK